MKEPMRDEKTMDDTTKQQESSDSLMMPWLMISQQLQGVERSVNQRIDDLKDDVRELKDDFRALREETQREIQTTKIELSNRLDKVETLSEKMMSRLNIYGVLVTILLAAIGLIVALRL